ncbi:hypothetical protein CAL7716_009680 [Calothrix sp. PCC 7716]|nr:hypothetical protein CAL7716_009680 [Calothrix sp. PCC 7716]
MRNLSKQIISGAKDGTVQLWNINTCSCIKTLNTNNGTVWSLAFSSNGLILAYGANKKINYPLHPLHPLPKYTI